MPSHRNIYPTENDWLKEENNFLLLCHSYSRPRSDLLIGINAILLPRGFCSLSNEAFVKFIFYMDMFFIDWQKIRHLKVEKSQEWALKEQSVLNLHETLIKYVF